MWKKILISFFIIVIIIAGLLGASYCYVKDKIYKDVSEGKDYEYSNAAGNKDNVNYKEVDGITNVLLIGVDKREQKEASRSDSMIIATLDSNNKKIKLTSLYRDTLVHIPGEGEEKINAAYQLGGIKLLLETIKKNYNINVSQYVIVDFTGFETIIDQVGGVEVEVKDYQLVELNKYIGESTGGNDCPIKKAGKQKLNGKQALSYARIRHGVGDDYERTERQREVILKMAEKVKETNPTKYLGIMSSMLDYLQTNIDPIEALDMAYTIYKFPALKTEQISIPVLEITQDMDYKNIGSVLISDLQQNSKILNDFIFSDKLPDPTTYDYQSFREIVEKYTEENNKYSVYNDNDDSESVSEKSNNEQLWD